MALACFFSTVLVAQSPQNYSVRVNGTPIAMARPAARLAGEWFVELDPVVTALGAKLTVDTSGQSLRILRGGGVTTSYDGATGRILQGSLLAGQVASFREIHLSPGAENVLFPLSGVVVLLGVTAHEDPDHDVLDIESLPPSATPILAGGPPFQLASLDYQYSLASDGLISQQSAVLLGEALAGGNRLNGSLELSHGAGNAILGFRQGSLRIETRSMRAITIGDQGTYIGVDAFSNTVRGLGYEWRWGRFQANMYGGIAASSTSISLGSAGLARYDSTLTGFGLRRRSKFSDFSVAGNVFDGSRRRGITFGAGLGGRFARNEFKLQGLVGYFSGFSLRPVLLLATPTPLTSTPLGTVVEVEREAGALKGSGYGFSLADTLTPFKTNLLFFTGAWDFYSKNFLVAREESRFSAVNRKSLSALIRPTRYLSFGASVKSSTPLLGSRAPEQGYTYSVNASALWRTQVQTGFFRSVQITGGPFGNRFGLSQYSLNVPRLDRYAISAVYTEVLFSGQLARSLNETLSVGIARFGRLGFHDQLQLRNNHNYGTDWSLQMGQKGAEIMVGLERQTAPGQSPLFAPVAAVNHPLPHRQSLKFSYFSVRGSRVLQFEIGGPIIRRREVVSLNNQTALIVKCSLSGQVYRDVDLDGKFTSGVDRPIAQLRVTLDDDIATTSDAGGYFRFDGVSPGSHRVRAEVATLPANFIFSNPDSIVAVLPYRANRLDYLAIPTGQIRGVVSAAMLDSTGTEVTQPFPDMRILASGDRDTFSEGDGAFALGDLPPGTYQLHLDAAKVPASYEVRPSLETVKVKPGQSVGGVAFVVSRSIVVRPAPSDSPQRAGERTRH